MAKLNQFTGYYECIIVKDAHIRDETFEVTIPTLFAVENQFQYNPNGKESNMNESMLAGTSKNATSINVGNSITAYNHTDYYYRLRGDIFKETMEGTDGITEEKAGGSGDAQYESHDHTIKKPISLFKFTFENLNNIKIIGGVTRAWGFFINGSMDKNSFAVVRIQGAVPLKKENLTNYVE